MKAKIMIGLIALSLGACDMGSGGPGPWTPDGGSTHDPVSAVLQFPDVPVPTSFKLDSQISFSKQKAGKRFGKLVYSGKMDLDELEKFMVDQLEFQQWKLQSKTLRGGIKALFFSKGDEEIEVFLSGSNWSTRLEIILG